MRQPKVRRYVLHHHYLLVVLVKSVAQTLGSGLAVTVSIGVSDWQPDDSATTLLHRADSRLYRAKH
ncbi:MAG: diguanylate cyclase, partial [Chloroflexia bacterium]|nr:diguanylate cyclase [Chloroflexia bacterium]